MFQSITTRYLHHIIPQLDAALDTVFRLIPLISLLPPSMNAIRRLRARIPRWPRARSTRGLAPGTCCPTVFVCFYLFLHQWRFHSFILPPPLCTVFFSPESFVPVTPFLVWLCRTRIYSVCFNPLPGPRLPPLLALNCKPTLYKPTEIRLTDSSLSLQLPLNPL
jgi:hypothetical protein